MHRHHPGWRLVLWAWADVYPKKPERSSEAQAFQIKENIKWPFKNMMLEKLLKNTLTFNPWNTFLRKWRLTLTICGDTQKQSDFWPSFVPPQSVLLYLNCERSFWITWQNFNYPLWINKWVFFFNFSTSYKKRFWPARAGKNTKHLSCSQKKSFMLDFYWFVLHQHCAQKQAATTAAKASDLTVKWLE